MRDAEFIALIAAVLISGTNTTPEEGVAKAQALITAARAAEKEEEE